MQELVSGPGAGQYKQASNVGTGKGPSHPCSHHSLAANNNRRHIQIHRHLFAAALQTATKLSQEEHSAACSHGRRRSPAAQAARLYRVPASECSAACCEDAKQATRGGMLRPCSAHDETRALYLLVQQSIGDKAFYKAQTLTYLNGYKREEPNPVVKDLSDRTEALAATYSPGASLGSPSRTAAAASTTSKLPQWVEQDRKVRARMHGHTSHAHTGQA